MAIVYPRFGRRVDVRFLRATNQMQEAYTADQEDRFEGMMLREMGSKIRSTRAVPTQYFLEGAVFPESTYIRSDPGGGR